MYSRVNVRVGVKQDHWGVLSSLDNSACVRVCRANGGVMQGLTRAPNEMP
jgi:hypothetical protein